MRDLGDGCARRERHREQAGGGDVLGGEHVRAELGRGRLGTAVEDRRVDDARKHRGEAHAARVLLECRAARERQQPRLGRLIARARHVWPAARDRPDQDHVSARRPDRAQEGVDDVEGSGEVDRQQRVEALGREAVEGAVGDVRAGGDDHGVNRARVGERPRERDRPRIGRLRRASGRRCPRRATAAGERPRGRARRRRRASAPSPLRSRSTLRPRPPPGHSAVVSGLLNVRVRRRRGKPSPGPAVPSTRRANVSGPSSSGSTGGSSPSDARPSASHSSACSKSAIVYA